MPRCTRVFGGLCKHWGSCGRAEQPEHPALWLQSMELAGQRVQGLRGTAVHLGYTDVVCALRPDDRRMPQKAASATVSGHSSQEPVEGQVVPLPESSEVATGATVCPRSQVDSYLWGHHLRHAAGRDENTGQLTVARGQWGIHGDLGNREREGLENDTARWVGAASVSYYRVTDVLKTQWLTMALMDAGEPMVGGRRLS